MWQFLTETAVHVACFEVEYDFSEGLSKRVTLRFFCQPPNLTQLSNPYDFAVARSYAKLAMAESLNYNICDFEKF